jgi:predicted DNA-binding protein
VRQTSLRLPDDLARAVELEAARWGTGKGDLIRSAISHYLGYLEAIREGPPGGRPEPPAPEPEA